jgi:hypothetical protein
MAFRAQVEVGLGADPQAGPGAIAWTDATQWIRSRMSIAQGRTDGFSTPPPSKLRLTADNTGGRWVARNPLGPWYGQVRRNMPIRVLCDADVWNSVLTDAFGRTSASGWGTSDSGQVWTTTEGFGGTINATDWTVSSGTARHSIPAGGYRVSRVSMAHTDVDVRWQTSFPVPTGGNLESQVSIRDSGTPRYICRVQVLPGGSVQVVLFRTATAGTFVIAGPTTIAGLTHSAGTPLQVRAQAYGSTVRMRVWQGASEPSTWHATVVDSSPIGAPGITVSLRHGIAAGNTNTLPVVFQADNVVVTTPPVRFAGYIDELPVSWDGSGRDSTVEVSASGFFRKLNQNSAPLRSAMYRARTSNGYGQPAEYWPMEDASGSTSYVNAVTGGASMAVSDQSPASSGVFEGSQPLPTWGASPTRAPIRPNATATSYGWRFGLYTLSLPPVNTAFVMWRTANWLWQVATSGSFLVLQAFDNTGVERLSAPLSIGYVAYQGRPLQVRANVAQNGADIDWSLSVTYFDVSGAATNNTSGTLAGVTVEWPYTVIPLGAGGPITGFTMGQLALYTDINAAPADLSGRGWPGNTAAARVAGILNDARIPHTVPPDPSGVSTTSLGPQAITSIPGQLKIAAAADGGQLLEDGLAVGYRSRWSLYSQTASLSISYSGLQLTQLTPADDDQQAQNDVTVSRIGGSSAKATNDAHIAMYGRAEDSVSISLYDDGLLQDQASWRVAAGSVDDLRYPTIAIDLVRDASLRPAWVQCQPGDRVQITGLPSELGVDLADLMLQGWSESIDSGGNVWTASLNCTSYKTWIAWVAEANSGDIGKVRSGAAFINTAFNSSATSISVKTTTGYPVWLTGAQSTLLWCGGEVMRVTFVSGSSSPQTFTVVRGVNGIFKSHAVGEQIDVYQPGVVVL